MFDEEELKLEIDSIFRGAEFYSPSDDIGVFVIGSTLCVGYSPGSLCDGKNITEIVAELDLLSKGVDFARIKVAPDFRRRGVARDMVHRMEGLFVRLGYEYVEVISEDTNAARGFWNNMGYRLDSFRNGMKRL